MSEFAEDAQDEGELPPATPPRRPSVASTAPAPHALGRDRADSDVPSSKFDGEDFLYHLYRGSELLQDNCIQEAKEELELALRVQPQDIEGQGLLGVVYFRLGLYPRAIEIYSAICRLRPEEISPRVNLALCFLKTGQSQLAREALEEITSREPEHLRAWGYLGLVYERLGEYEKAALAFDRAQQPNLARRMQQRQAEQQSPPIEPGNRREDSGGRAALSEAARGLGRVDLSALPEPLALSREASLPGLHSDRPASLRPLADARQSVVAPDRRSALVPVAAAWAARSDAVRGLLARGAAFSQSALLRRQRGRDSHEPLGGPGAPWVLLRGAGQILLGASPERELTALELDDSSVYVRESCLVGFPGTAQHENGRLPTGSSEPVAMVQISGHGSVLLESRKPPRVLEVIENQKLAVRADDVVGWIGRLLGQPLDLSVAPLHSPGFVAFSGRGSVLIDLG